MIAHDITTLSRTGSRLNNPPSQLTTSK